MSSMVSMADFWSALPPNRFLIKELLRLVLAAAVLTATARSRAEGPTQANIRADGILVVNGAPVFPIGMRTEKLDSLEQISKAGFNLVLGSGEWGRRHYQLASKHKLLTLAGFYEWATFASFRHGNGVDLTLEEDEALKNLQRQARDQGGRLIHEALGEFDSLPGVIGWNVNEEPEAKLVELLEYAYEIFKARNPEHIVVSLVSGHSVHWLHLYKRTCDVLIVDVYPFRGSAQNRGSIIESYTRVRQAVEEMDGKPVWLMSQAIPPSYFSRVPSDEMSLTDARLHHYLGLIAGAQGVIMYQWATVLDAYDRDGVQQADESKVNRRLKIISDLVSELKKIAPILINGRVTEDVEFRWIGPGNAGPGLQVYREIDWLGKKYVLVANPLDVAVEGLAFGVNGGNRDAFAASVLLGGSDLTITPPLGEGEKACATVKIGPRGCGVLLFERRPIPTPSD